MNSNQIDDLLFVSAGDLLNSFGDRDQKTFNCAGKSDEYLRKFNETTVSIINKLISEGVLDELNRIEENETGLQYTSLIIVRRSRA